jgi:hypothetical protein
VGGDVTEQNLPPAGDACPEHGAALQPYDVCFSREDGIVVQELHCPVCVAWMEFDWEREQWGKDDAA